MKIRQRQMLKTVQSRELPATLYLVLGCLLNGQQSGYDVKQYIDSEIAHIYTSPAKSQIYSELRRLESLGYATMEQVSQTLRPDKRLYAITPAGREAFAHWLANDPAADSVKSPLMLQVYFGAHTSPAVFRSHWGKRLAVLQERCNRLQDALTDQVEPCRKLALYYAVLQTEAACDWATHAIAHIEA